MSDDNPLAAVDRGGVGKGFVIGAVLNLLQAGLLWLIVTDGGSSALAVLIVGLDGFSLIQLIYMVPIYLYFRSKDQTETAKGLMIAAAIVMLTNAGCWLAVMR